MPVLFVCCMVLWMAQNITLNYSITVNVKLLYYIVQMYNEFFVRKYGWISVVEFIKPYMINK